MKRSEAFAQKIVSREEAVKRVAQWRVKGDTIAFTNGVFDVLHRGHVFSLASAAKEADYLVVGLNSDASVKRLKGESRPLNNQDARSLLMAALHMVDLVVLFDEDTPLELILALEPNVLVKGGDYTVEQVAGAREVLARGGRVVINPIVEGYSSTRLIESLKD